MNQERNNRDFNTCRTRTIIWFHTPVLRGPSFYRKDTETRMSQVGAVVQSEMELGVTDTFISLMVMMVSKCTPMSQPVCVLSCSVVTDSLQSMNCSPSGSSVRGILQARILEWVAVSSSRGSSQPRDQICVFCVSCIGRQILYHCITWEALCHNLPNAYFKSVQFTVWQMCLDKIFFLNK